MGGGQGILTGSSPLTRGKLDGLHEFDVERGLIPAHAGKTDGWPSVTSDRAAHPRSRGENKLTSASRRDSLGSSPLTRGKPHGKNGVPAPGRLIPAHAGKTGEVQ